MRGIKEFNFPAFFAAEESLSEYYEVYNPARADNIDTKTLLGEMVFYGKAFYFSKQMLPCIPDSIS